MPFRRYAAALAVLLAAVLASGCAGSRLPAEPAQSLGEVNRRLDGRWATVEHTDGSTAEFAEDVHVGPDTTTYCDRRERERKSVPTREVRRVLVRKDAPGAAQGFLKGALPGLAVAAGSVLLGRGSGDLEDDAVATLMLLASVPLTVAGSLAGGVRNARSEDERSIVYEGPATRYRTSPGARW